MLRSASKILGYRLHAQDGEVGRCVDFLLEQSTWIIRHVLVDAGPRLEGRRVLVSPLRLRKLEWTPRRWVLEGTRAQVETEPWSAPRLQSFQRLIGFGLDDAEGNVGQIEDVIVDDDDWHCRYLVVNGEIQLAGRRTLVPTAWLGSVLGAEQRVQAPVARARIASEPEFRPEAPVYDLHATANDAEAPAARRERVSPPSWSPALAWTQAVNRGVQWGTRALEAAFARAPHGRQ